MFDDLDIQNTRERLLVGLADRALGVAALPGRLMPARPRATPRRVLLLRLERPFAIQRLREVSGQRPMAA